MPPAFHPTSLAMNERGDQYWRWALPGSFILHVLIAALLIFELPIGLPQPEEEQAIAVDLVPPPEPDQAKAEPAPRAEEPKPDKVEQQTSPPTRNEPVRAPAPPALQPVFQFGERDAGPRKSAEGNSAEDGSVSPAPESAEPNLAEHPIPAPDQPDNQASQIETSHAPEEKPAEAPESKPETPDAGATKQAEDGGQAQNAPALAVPSNPDRQDGSAPSGAKASEFGDEVQLPAMSETPTPRPVQVAGAPPRPKLQRAKRLYSQAATGDQVATTAMGALPRDVRGGRLCVTELREQLLRGSPPYFPDLLPSYPLQRGTVIEVSDAAFRVRGQWFDLGFRCEVDSGATKVVSFAFGVGAPLPRSEWVRRGLPAQ